MEISTQLILDKLEEIKESLELKLASPTNFKPMTIDEASEFLGKSKSAIYTLIHREMIPFYKRDRTLYFFQQELIDWIKNQS